MDAFKDLPDLQLLALLKEGNRLAFNELYFRYWEKMYRSAFNVIRDEAAAKDIVQDIFLGLWRKRQIQDIENLSAYLFQSVKFQVAKCLKKGRFTQHHQDLVANISITNSTEDEINYQESNGRLNFILDQFPVKRREVFSLSRFEQLSNQEIAKKLNLSPRTVEWHISNALKQIRQYIGALAILIDIFLNVLR